MTNAPHPIWQRLSGGSAPSSDPQTLGDLTPIVEALRRPFAEALLGSAMPENLKPSDEERALGRLVWARQRETVVLIREFSALPMKGYASALTLYETPSARCIGDLDILIPERNLPALLKRLEGSGFWFGAPDTRRWGFQSTVSFLPMTSADGLVEIDLHIAPDEGPLGAGLSVEDVMAAAVTLPDGTRVPCPTHAALIAISNLAKERFEPYVLRTLVDLTRLARGGEVDWDMVSAVLTRVGMGPAWAVVAKALVQIVPVDMPAGLPRSAASGAQADMARSLVALDLVEIGGLRKAIREATLCYTPSVSSQIWLRRLTGLLRPRTGLPSGLSAQTSN